MKAPRKGEINFAKMKFDKSLAEKITTKESAKSSFYNIIPAYLKAMEDEKKAQATKATCRAIGFLGLDVLYGKDQPGAVDIEHKGKTLRFRRFEQGGKDQEIVNPEKLQELLSDEQWDAVTDKVLNEEKLAQAVSRGLIGEGIIKTASEMIKTASTLAVRVLDLSEKKEPKEEMLAPVLKLTQPKE